MEINIFNTAAEVSSFVAKEVLKQVEHKSDSNIALATGRTMDAAYHMLVQFATRAGTSFSNVKAFAVDEYVGLNSHSLNSYEAYLKLHLFDQLDFKKENIFIPQSKP
ncbi:MAG: glucosamine-6-phosphate deaminase, partial [Halobacteriovoraceae bacterium]|nr:glucosamine-6-phosphate deaminase [Halobacteriovoraceae bacterium]